MVFKSLEAVEDRLVEAVLYLGESSATWSFPSRGIDWIINIL